MHIKNANGLKVVLVNPRNDLVTFKKFEVLGLGYIASWLEAEGVLVDIYDANFQDRDPKAMALHCLEFGADVVGITTMVGSVRNACTIAKTIRRYFGREVQIVLGGYATTFDYDVVMRECEAVDFVVRGEGEITFSKLLDALTAKDGISGRFDTIGGLVYRGTDREPLLAKGEISPPDLDAMPLPRRSPHLEEIGVASILSSRGCIARCAFCSIQEFYRLNSEDRPVRCRAPIRVADEIDGIHRATGIKRFLFIDDNFFGTERLYPGRLAALAGAVLAKKLTDIHFEASSRSTDMVLPTLEQLAQAGLDRVYLGIESGSQKQLNRYRKGATVEKNIWALQEIRARGVDIDIGYIPFDPYVTPEDILANLRFMLDHDLVRPETLNTVTVVTNLFPGTSLHERAQQDKLLHRTPEFYFWFEFADRRLAPVFDAIVRYFKVRYIIPAIDVYANGKRQQGFVGPALNDFTPGLRRLFGLWIERTRALLEGLPTNRIEADAARIENLLTNCASAVALYNRHRNTPEMGNNLKPWLQTAEEVLRHLSSRIGRHDSR